MVFTIMYHTKNQQFNHANIGLAIYLAPLKVRGTLITETLKAYIA